MPYNVVCSRLERIYRKIMIPQTEFIKQLLIPTNETFSPKNFVKYIEDTSLYWEKEIRQSIKEFLEDMDNKFRNSPDRKKRYYVAYTGKRTIICMYGEITYTRTLYKDRLDGSYYCYVDEKLGIDKYIRYTNDVACYASEAYADENSMEKIGIEIGNLIYAKFSLKDNRDYALPRQTIYNLMKRSKEIRIESKAEKKVIDDIYVLTDEKYLPGHKKLDGTSSSKMLKSALIVEGLDSKDSKRHKYINPQYLSLYKSKNFANDILEYLNDRYDLEKLKHIHVLGDGATWIKTTANDLKCPNAQLTQYLCKFHFSQGLWRIFKDKPLYSKAIDYLYHNDKKNLYELFKSVEETETTKRNIEYIKNNYDLIQNTIHLKNMNCAMEQCISHHIHSEFDNVPKVYGDNNLNRYCSYRDNYRNKENMKQLFLEALEDNDNESSKTVINKTLINLEHFDNQAPLPYYSLKLEDGKNPVSFKCPSSLSFI